MKLNEKSVSQLGLLLILVLGLLRDGQIIFIVIIKWIGCGLKLYLLVFQRGGKHLCSSFSTSIAGYCQA